jgi:hypothetical protein
MSAYFSLPQTFHTAYAIDIHPACGIVRMKFGWTVHKDQVVGEEAMVKGEMRVKVSR